MNTDLISKIDQSIEGYKETLELGSALDRLMMSRDFRKVVTEGYLSKKAVELVHRKGQPSQREPAQQQSILAQIDAIGYFNQYLNEIREAVEIARKGLLDDEQSREDILSQDNN